MDTKKTQTCFDEIMAEADSHAPNFRIKLTSYPHEFVFRRTRGWDDYRAIRDKAAEVVKATMKRIQPEEFMAVTGSDMLPVLRSVHFSMRHVGFIKTVWSPCDEPSEPSDVFRKTASGWQVKEEKFVDEPWGELSFLKLSQKDPHGFQSMVDALDAHISVGWSVEDRDYFREAAEAS